jgi:hypothetical protein
MYLYFDIVENSKIDPAISVAGFSRKYLEEKFDGGFKIDYVKDSKGIPMSYMFIQLLSC